MVEGMNEDEWSHPEERECPEERDYLSHQVVDESTPSSSRRGESFSHTEDCSSSHNQAISPPPHKDTNHHIHPEYGHTNHHINPQHRYTDHHMNPEHGYKSTNYHGQPEYGHRSTNHRTQPQYTHSNHRRQPEHRHLNYHTESQPEHRHRSQLTAPSRPHSKTTKPSSARQDSQERDGLLNYHSEVPHHVTQTDL